MFPFVRCCVGAAEESFNRTAELTAATSTVSGIIVKF